MAAANSNTATRHILQAGLYLTAETAECLSLRISDILEYSPTADAFIQAIGTHNVATLEEMKDLYLYDFGIFISLQPDEEEKMQQEVMHKKELMHLEFQYNMQLKGIEVDGVKDRERQKEDRKDQRTKIQATQQSEMIDQRQTGKPPKDFESVGNDVLGGIDMSEFGPR